jgi:hypothetical protein
VVGFWRLGESSGTAACEALGNVNGNYSGGVTLARPGALASDPDTAVAMNGSSGQVSVPHASRFSVGDVFTAEAWVKRGAVSTAGNQTVLSKSSAWLLMINSANRIALRKSNVGDVAISSATITDTTRFHHVVATREVCRPICIWTGSTSPAR